MKKKLYLLITALMMFSLIILSACGTQNLEKLLSKVDKHMTEKEVIKIMGDDFERDEYGVDGEYCLTWVNEDDTEGGEVYFDADEEAKEIYYYDEEDWTENKKLKEENEEVVEQQDISDENDADKEKEPDSENEVQADLTDKDDEIQPVSIGGYEFGEYDKFNSPASENGLGGTKIYVYGKCTEVFAVDTAIVCNIENGSDKWAVTLWDTGKLGEIDFSFFEGNKMYVFGEYLGYSGTLNSPVVHFETILCNSKSYDFESLALGGVLDSVFDD